jgi:single-strand DNA-binding protein
MSSFNLVVIMGNITRDIELRYTPSNTAVTDISVAINEKRKGANGEWIEEVTFVDVTLWGRTAEVASQYLGKGSPILIEGRLKQDTWEKDGKKHSRLKVIGENMRMIGGKGEGRGGSGGGGGERYERSDRGGSAPARSGGGRPNSAPPPADEYAQSGSDNYSEGGDIPF